jgi:hypothetical protein
MTDQGPPHILTALDGLMNEVTAMGKDGRQQNFQFRSYDGAINIIGPAFRRHKVCPSYKVTSMERRTYQAKGGTTMQETMVRLTYTLTSLVDGSTHVLAEDVPGEASDAGDKSASKSVTVACRLALLHGFAIPTQDPDPDEQSHERAAPEPVKLLTADQAELMTVVTKELDENSRGELNHWYKGQQLPKKENLSERQADMVLLKMSALLKAQTEVDVKVPDGVDAETGEVVHPEDPF